ncbi:MAG: hypothetical protein K2Q20_08110, partial [Phycisphaerales bacterium]|nr:hypothetical protein [Phycisphaerales bacterium]
MSRRHAVILAASLLVHSATPAFAMRAAEPAPLSSRVDNLDTRLAALSPAKPAAYLELGELVMQEAVTPDERRLARELLVLALTTATARPTAQTAPAPLSAEHAAIASSACLALAAIADDQPTARWLAAVGASLAPDAGLEATPQDAASSASRDPAALDLATLLGLVRSGDGRRAERLLAR